MFLQSSKTHLHGVPSTVLEGGAIPCCLSAMNTKALLMTLRSRHRWLRIREQDEYSILVRRLHIRIMKDNLNDLHKLENRV